MLSSRLACCGVKTASFWGWFGMVKRLVGELPNHGTPPTTNASRIQPPPAATIGRTAGGESHHALERSDQPKPIMAGGGVRVGLEKSYCVLHHLRKEMTLAAQA